MDGWFLSGTSLSFHQACLNELAKSLTLVNKETQEKEAILLSHCPSLTNPDLPLHGRGLDAVVSLGLYALQNKDGCSSSVVNYLVRLIKHLPSASWIHFTKFEDGLITRDFYYKLSLILTTIAVSYPSYKEQISDALLESLHLLITRLLDIGSFSVETYCMEIVPSLAGLCSGLAGTQSQRLRSLDKLYDHKSDNDQVEDLGQMNWTTQQLNTLFSDIQKLFLATDVLETADKYLAKLPNAKSYPFPVIGSMLKCVMLCLLNDILINSANVTEEESFRSSIFKFVEDNLKECTRFVRSVEGGGGHRMQEVVFYTVKMMCAATNLLVWSAKDGDSVFLYLSSLLAFNTGKLNVLVSPLRAIILESLSKLAVQFPSLINGTLARLNEFLLSSLLLHMYSDAISTGYKITTISSEVKTLMNESVVFYSQVHISRSDGFTLVFEALCNAVIRILTEDKSVITSFIGTLGNKIYTTDNTNESAVRTVECIIQLLGKVAVALADEGDVLSHVVGVFQQRMFRPTSSLDGTIVTQLGIMAAELGNSETLEVLSRLMGEALGVAVTPYPMSSSSNSLTKEMLKQKRIESSSYNHIFLPVMDALVYVAVHLKGDENRLDFLQRVLQSFIQQGIEGKRASERKEVSYSLKASSSSFSLGLLLPVLATLCQSMEPLLSPSPRILRLFRDFWLYCMLLGFSDAEKGVFPPLWYNNVRDIAAKSPLLIISGAEKYLDKELELNHPLKKGDITVGELQEARLALQDALGRSVDLDKLVYRLTFAQCMYLQSIYRLETVRLEKDSRCFSYIFQYLDDGGLQKELWVAMEAIAEKLFNRLLLLLSDKPCSREREEELESHATLLIFKFNHLRGRIKRLADIFLSRLVDKFPHLLWNKVVLHTMLDLLQELSIHIYTPDPEKCIVTEVKLPNVSHTITLPDYMAKRESTVVNFAKRCGEIIDLAIKWAPSETKSILENYVAIESHALNGLLHHSGVSLASSQLINSFESNTTTMYTPVASISQHPDCLKDTRSQPLSSVILQSQFLGGVNTAVSLLGAEGLNTLSERATGQLTSAIEKGDLSLATTALYNLTALLISNKGDEQNRTLLHNIVDLPIRAFREDIISVATHCWQWLINSVPHLEYNFMREFCSSWHWTITEAIGMFSCSSKKLKPCNVQPHVVLIDFLVKRFEVFRTRSTSLISLTSQLIHQSLTLGVGPTGFDQPQRLTTSIAACSARFKFLTLAVQLIKEGLITNTMDRMLLREKVYNAALDYFCYHPLWIVGDINGARKAMDSLIKFWQAVKELKNTIIPNQLTGTDITPTALPRNSSFWQALSTDGPSGHGSWLNTMSSRNNTRAQSLNIAPASTSRRSTSNVKSRVLLKRRNVVLALLRHEVERLSAWINPHGLSELLVPGEENLQSWINPTQTDRHWRNTVTMAFQASPHLAFYVYYRFRNIEAVSKEFSRLIITNPFSFIDIPEAAQCLATKESVEKDSKELYHLLYWRGIPPAMALIYFTKTYSTHSITGQFANKAMKSFKPSEILQYIPQLVQALRYDKLGFAKDYILSAAQSSQVLAHQFLWNIQANTYLDEEGEEKDPEIGVLLENLSKEILQNLSGAALKFYEREFSFFKKVTDISGTIRPYPKPERKQECLKALSKITLEPGVYLPSNPEAIVVNIDYKSGTPMQSAAKAPFLAKFGVKPCSINEMEKLNTQEDTTELEKTLKSLNETPVWQGSIFKVGDDVRQDMLALQIIKLFKDVYNDLGLQLYLVPYRVVATAAGCGVIEVIPDSKSRDQLGKQTQVSLKDYFISIYGEEDSFLYQEARSNFICSMAAYSLISYLLQIKDRHNGNIMLDKWGHIIHIDFGFLFESSPGGNLGFEPDLKLTEEMLDIMGGKKSNSYQWFLDLCVQGYLAIRPYQDQVVAMVTLMLDTGFPCFRGNTIEELKFRGNLSEKEAAKAIIEVVESSCLNFRTTSYDIIQDVQQNIYYHKK